MESASVGFDRWVHPAGREDHHGAGASWFEGFNARPNRLPGGNGLIDDDDTPAREQLGVRKPERTRYVARPPARIDARLTLRPPAPEERFPYDFHTEPERRPFGEQRSLVVTSLALPRRVERHREEEVIRAA